MALFTKKTGGASPIRRLMGESVALRLGSNRHVKRAAVEGADIYYQPDFLNSAQCATLIRLIETDRHPSTLLSEHADAGFRTSESCDMDRWSPEVRPIDESIANLLGVDPVHGETMQGQRYAVGQQFRAHHDYFNEDQPYWPKMQENGGQRTWTAMIFLNTVEEGGATWFPLAGIRVSPKPGLLLAWNNMNPDGSPNTNTLHEGMPVVAGTKYIVTKWFREGNWIKA